MKLRLLTVFFIFGLSPCLWAQTFGFRVPSYVAIQGGLSDQDSQFVSAAAGITLRKNWILGLTVENVKTASIDENESLTSNGGGVSLMSDPLEDFSFLFALDGWRTQDAAQAVGGKIAGTWARQKWVWTLLVGVQQYTFFDLPPLIWAEETSTVTETSAGLAVDFLISSQFSLRASHTAKWHDKDMEEYASGLRTLIIPPEVVTSASTVNKEDSLIAANYSLKRWNFGLSFGTGLTAFDSTRTSGVGLNCGFKISHKWSTQLTFSRYQSEGGSEDVESSSDPMHSGSLGATYAF